MKKNDILTILKANKQIHDLQKLVDYTVYKGFVFGPKEKEEQFWLSKLMDFPEEREILIKEIREAQRKYKEANLNKNVCSHDIIIVTDENNRFWSASTYECAICEEKLNLNDINPKENSERIFIKNNIQFDGDYWYHYEKGMSRKEIIEHLLAILEKYDSNDKIDLINEFLLLNLKEKDITIKSPTKILTKQRNI